MSCTPSSASWRCFASALLVLGLSAAASAEEPPAALWDSQDRAQSSFERFADEWMTKVQSSTVDAQQRPTIRPGANGGPMITYRGYGDDYSVELRPTGHASAPYVGILRYQEQVYSCRDAQATDCSVASTIPVTEIFRFQNGRWVY